MAHIPAGLSAVFADAELGKAFAHRPDPMNKETLPIMVKTLYSP